MKFSHCNSFACLALVFSVAIVRAAAPVAAISASPTSGNAPLGVFFDASSSSEDVNSYLWDFGDGSVSTAKTVTHVYNVAGTYIATLTVFNASGQNSSQVAITVTGTGQGPVSPDINFRWSINSGSFTLNHSAANKDSLTLNCTFNTVDLPGKLNGLAASFSINDTFSVVGVIGAQNGFQSADKRKPDFLIVLDDREQTLTVYISKADLHAALAESGATNATFPAPGTLVPITFKLAVGAQTYQITEQFTYVSTANGQGKGQFNLKKNLGGISDGFFVISQASALETAEGTAHFYEFDGYVSKAAGLMLQLPPANGTYTFRFNEADPVILLSDRFTFRKDSTGLITTIIYDQPDRDLGGIRHLQINTITRKFVIKTWDILRDERNGGTGLPGRGRPFTAFNFTVRLDFDQPAGDTFQAVTATRLTRKTNDDAFWQTGRGKK